MGGAVIHGVAFSHHLGGGGLEPSGEALAELQDVVVDMQLRSRPGLDGPLLV